jgi:hypothetical protein
MAPERFWDRRKICGFRIGPRSVQMEPSIHKSWGRQPGNIINHER